MTLHHFQNHSSCFVLGLFFFSSRWLPLSVNKTLTGPPHSRIHRGSNLVLWQHPRSRESRQDVAPAVQGPTPPCQWPTGNNYRSGLHRADSPWHSSAVWTLRSRGDCQGPQPMNVFQISSKCDLLGRGSRRRRPRRRRIPARCFWRLADSCKQEIYYRGTRRRLSAEKSEQVAQGRVVLSRQLRNMDKTSFISRFYLLRSGWLLFPAGCWFGSYDAQFTWEDRDLNGISVCRC